MKLPKLYAKTKSEDIKIYEVWAEGDKVICQYGLDGGKLQTATITAKPKNIGRSNETTGAQQAELEAKSKWNKKIDKGYFENINDANTKTVLLPMLATDLKKREDKVTFPIDIQPKLKGVRCLAKWNGKSYDLISRGGKPWNMPHIISQLNSIDTNRDIILDGELYLHGLSQQQCNRLVKKWRHNESDKIQYHIYDCFIENLPMTWKERRNILEGNELKGINATNNISIIQTKRIVNITQLRERHDIYVSNNYEGLIARELDGMYEISKRSLKLLKYKDFSDDEYEIVGYKEGNGKFEKCVIWQCKIENGTTFWSTPRGSLVQKKKWFSDADKYIGKQLTVRYKDKTDAGIPEINVGIAIRLDNDL